jgi:hypothetical protein
MRVRIWTGRRTSRRRPPTIDALADDAKDEEAVNPVPWVKDVYVLGGSCARHTRWCGHAVAFDSTSAKPDDVVDLRQSEFV